MKPPSTEQIEFAMDNLELDAELDGLTFLWATVVGSLGNDRWVSGDDVDIRAVYALPTERYLGLRSFHDEFETLSLVGSTELDLVGLEVEKVARLILKGHRPTLAWLTKQPLLATKNGRLLGEIASNRLSQLGSDAKIKAPTASRKTYETLDQFVRRARLGHFV